MQDQHISTESRMHPLPGALLSEEEQEELRFYEQAISANLALREAVVRLTAIQDRHLGTEVSGEAAMALAAVKRLVEQPRLRSLPDFETATGEGRR